MSVQFIQTLFEQCKQFEIKCEMLIDRQGVLITMDTQTALPESINAIIISNKVFHFVHEKADRGFRYRTKNKLMYPINLTVLSKQLPALFCFLMSDSLLIRTN
jgi:hypothetical protein